MSSSTSSRIERSFAAVAGGTCLKWSSFPLQGGSQSQQGAVLAVADGPLADPQRGGDVGRLHLLQEAHDQDLLILRRQLGERGTDLLALLLSDQPAAGTGPTGQQAMGQFPDRLVGQRHVRLL